MAISTLRIAEILRKRAKQPWRLAPQSEREIIDRESADDYRLMVNHVNRLTEKDMKRAYRPR